MIGRRGLLLAAACAAGGVDAVALPVPPGDQLSFRMVRRGSEIGRHTLIFDQRGDTLTVRIAAAATVTLLSVPVVRYTHNVTETWRDDKLTGLNGETNKNGTRQWVDARRTGEGLVVRGSQTARYIAPETAIGTSYWNRRMIEGPMISLEDGVLLRPKVAAVGTDTVQLASGGAISAEHYNISGAFNVDVWYDHADTWASLALIAADHSTVHYERL